MNNHITRLRILTAYLIIVAMFAACAKPKPQPPVVVVKPQKIAPTEFSLTVLHTNDTHARIMQFNKSGITCSDQETAQGQCFGGVARRATVIKQVKALESHTIVVDAGDQFQGTLLYTLMKGKPSQEFMNELGYDAMTLGNHEFDDGPPVLADFIKGLKFSVISSNLHFDTEPLLKGLIKPYDIKELDGRKVGIMGDTTEEVASLSKPGPSVVVQDIDSSMKETVGELEKQGVNIIVLLSHAGLARDLELAASTVGIDIIVGGHTHSFLSNTDPESDGPYPMMVTSPAGEPVLVVQAGAWGKYIGHLQVTFDQAGVAEEWTGDPVLLDDAIPEDPKVLADAQVLDDQLEAFRRETIGQASVELGGTGQVCRYEECNIGDLIADAMLWETRSQGAEVAFFNGGGIRAGIPPGNITMENVMEVLPFLDTLAVFELRGEDVVQVLEHSVSRAESNQNEGTGRFLQMSGISFSWDPNQPVGDRVSNVKVKNAEGNFVPLKNDETYKIATSGFLRNGGDGFDIFDKKAINPYDFGRVLSDIFVDYVKQISPVDLKPDGRIVKKPFVERVAKKSGGK